MTTYQPRSVGSGKLRMSGAGTAKKPPTRFCWVCSRQLRGNFHRIVIGQDGNKHAVHADCDREGGLEIVDGAHLSGKK